MLPTLKLGMLRTPFKSNVLHTHTHTHTHTHQDITTPLTIEALRKSRYIQNMSARI